VKLDQYSFSMEREFFGLIAYFTFFKNGRRLFDKHEIFESIESMVQSNKYDHIISVFLLSLNYMDCQRSVNFLNFTMKKGSDYI